MPTLRSATWTSRMASTTMPSPTTATPTGSNRGIIRSDGFEREPSARRDRGCLPYARRHGLRGWQVQQCPRRLRPRRQAQTGESSDLTALNESLRRAETEDAYLTLGDMDFEDGKYNNALADYGHADRLKPGNHPI